MVVSAISSRPSHSGEPTRTPAKPKRLFASLKDCSIQPRCHYQEAALRALPRLVASYQGSLGCLRRGFFARLLDTLQHKATLSTIVRGRPW
jgi:hypothetical protein